MEWERTRVGRITSGISALVDQSCVFGEPAAWLRRSVVFLLLRVILRARVQRWLSFRQFPGSIFYVFLCPGLIF